jgi:hypothetical protein
LRFEGKEVGRRLLKGRVLREQEVKIRVLFESWRVVAEEFCPLG